MDHSALFELLFLRAQEGYQPTSLEGVLHFVFPDAPKLECHVSIRHEGLSLSRASLAAADIRVTMDSSMLKAFVNPWHLDARNIDDASIRVDGESKLRLVFDAVQILKRPLPESEALINRIDRSTAYGQADSMRILNGANAESLSAAARLGVPVVAKGLMNNMQARSMDMENMSARFGTLHLRRNARTASDETVKDFFDSMRAANIARRVYSDGCAIPEEMKAAFRLPALDQLGCTNGQMWFGRKREDKPVTGLHRDVAHSFLMHFWGRKKFWLYPPSQAKKLYPRKAYNSYQPCLVQLHQYDETLHPEFKTAKPIEYMLEPGDLLLIPAGWFHCAWALDDVFSVSRFCCLDVAA